MSARNNSKASKAQAEARTEAQMKALMQSLPTDDDEATELWLEAEALVERYIGAVQERSANLPDRQELGVACFRLLAMVQLLGVGDNYKFAATLLTPEIGVEMYALLPRVQKLQNDAVAELHRLANTPELQPPSEPRQPAEDLF